MSLLKQTNSSNNNGVYYFPGFILTEKLKGYGKYDRCFCYSSIPLVIKAQ